LSGDNSVIRKNNSKLPVAIMTIAAATTIMLNVRSHCRFALCLVLLLLLLVLLLLPILLPNFCHKNK
jgi:hypothetical protein